MGDNAAQIADWNGVVGQRWAQLQGDLDRLVGPYGAAALARAAARPGEQVIDVGCGCGQTSFELARATGATGSVLGVDVSAPMLTVARERAQAAGLPHVRFADGDAAVAPLPAGQDLIFSRFGVMFFDDPIAAFTHLRGALKPQGRLAFTCWRSMPENPWAYRVLRAVRDSLELPDPPADPLAPGPFAFAARERVAEVLAQAGFGAIDIQPFDAPAWLGPDLEYAVNTAVHVGPSARLIREQPPERQPVAIAAIRQSLKAFDHGAGVAPGGAVWIVSARNP